MTLGPGWGWAGGVRSGEVAGGRGSLTGLVGVDFSRPRLAIPGDKAFLFSWYREDIFHLGVLSLALREGKEGKPETSCTCRFSRAFSSKSSLYRSGIFWGDPFCNPLHL